MNIYRKLFVSLIVGVQYFFEQIMTSLPVYISCLNPSNPSIYPINIWMVMFIHAISWMMALALIYKFSDASHHQPLAVD
jgi:hypothetical protein